MFSDKARWIVAVVLRMAAAGAAAVAAVLMAMCHETVTVFGMEVQANFRYTPSLVFFVAANAAVSACSVVVLLVPVPTATSKLAARLLLMADVVLGMVLTGAVAAAGAISDLGKNGNSHAGWMAICEQVPVFCDRVRSALIAGSVAIVLYYLMLMYSIYILPLFP